MPTKKSARAEEAAGPLEVPTDPRDPRWVEVYPEPGMQRDTARALLAAAGRLGYDESRAVVSIGDGFRVTADVLAAADLPDEPTPDDTPAAQVPLEAIAAGAMPNPDGTDAGS